MHLSYFEADAFARWAGRRALPTEFEWETAAQTADVAGLVRRGGRLHPAPAGAPETSHRATAPRPSPPCARCSARCGSGRTASTRRTPATGPSPGALGEYNGKFMSNQFVLRGASVATSRTHARATYRNFFPPEATWQFTGLRLARSV